MRFIITLLALVLTASSAQAVCLLPNDGCGGGGGSDTANLLSGASLTDAGLEYVYSMSEFNPAAIERTGGWSHFYFSWASGNELGTGNDSNDCSRTSPCLTVDRAVEIAEAVPGAMLWFDGADGAWTGATNYGAGFYIDDLPCTVTTEPCVIVRAMKPESPLILDPTSGSGANIFGVSNTADADQGWLLGENITVANANAQDVFDTDNTGKLLCLNCAAGTFIDDGADQAFTAHADSVTWVLNGSAESSASSTSTETDIALNSGNGFIGLIGKGDLLTAADGSSGDNACLRVSGGGEVIAVGHRCVTAASRTNDFIGIEAVPGVGLTATIRTAHLYIEGDYSGRVGSSPGVWASSTGVGSALIVDQFRNTITDVAHGLWMNAQAPPTVLTWTCVDCIVEDTGVRIVNSTDTDVGEGLSVTFDGTIDEDDVVGSFKVENVTYTELSLAQDGVGDEYNLWEDAGSGDSCGTGVECAQWDADATPTLTLPIGSCHSAQECNAAVSGTYTMPIANANGLPFIFPDVVITGFALSRGDHGSPR